MPVWKRFVAIGDSFTEGLSDVDPVDPQRYRGWADRLAALLAEQAEGRFGYANLAVRGRTLDDVVGPQLDAALAMQPDLVSVSGAATTCSGRGPTSTRWPTISTPRWCGSGGRGRTC